MLILNTKKYGLGFVFSQVRCPSLRLVKRARECTLKTPIKGIYVLFPAPAGDLAQGGVSHDVQRKEETAVDTGFEPGRELPLLSMHYNVCVTFQC